MEDAGDQEQLYRIQLLQAFDLTEWNDTVINTTIAELYARLSNVPIFADIFLQARANTSIIEMLDLLRLNGEEHLADNEIIFQLLFKFEFFDLFHRCIVDYFVNNTLSAKYMTNLVHTLTL